jgi:hypothetical protein
MSMLNVKTSGIGSLNRNIEDPFIEGASFKDKVNIKSNLAQSSSNLLSDVKMQKLNSARQKNVRTNT